MNTICKSYAFCCPSVCIGHTTFYFWNNYWWFKEKVVCSIHHFINTFIFNLFAVFLLTPPSIWYVCPHFFLFDKDECLIINIRYKAFAIMNHNEYAQIWGCKPVVWQIQSPFHISRAGLLILLPPFVRECFTFKFFVWVII